MLGDFGGASKKAEVCSRLDAIRKWAQFNDPVKKELSLSQMRKMFRILWVYKDLVFVCNLAESQQFIYIRCYFLSQKENLIDNEKIFLTINIQIKKKKMNLS